RGGYSCSGKSEQGRRANKQSVATGPKRLARKWGGEGADRKPCGWSRTSGRGRRRTSTRKQSRRCPSRKRKRRGRPRRLRFRLGQRLQHLQLRSADVILHLRPIRDHVRRLRVRLERLDTLPLLHHGNDVLA